MEKENATAKELQQMIQDRINNSSELDGDCQDVIANAVYWHEQDETGCNWDLHSFRGDRACAGVVNAIVSDLRQRYNLVED